MSFLNATMLFGSLAVAIPVLIHLLNRRRVQHISWAAMRFLRESVEQNRRRMRIEDILLLLLRCALLSLLALTLSRPAIGGAAGGLFGRGATTAVIIIDSSYSMSATDGVRSTFARAKDVAGEIIDGFASGSTVAVWLSSDVVDPLIPEPTADLGLARSTIAGAIRCDRATNVTPALRRAIDLMHASSAPHKEIFFLTDGQASGWKQMADIRQMLASTDVRTNLIFISTPLNTNLTLSDLRPVGELMLTNRPIRFLATVNNNGNADAHDVRVTLKIDGGEPADEAVIPSIAAGESRSVSLVARLNSEGIHTLAASVPADRLPADDSRTIAVRAMDGVKVLLVDGNPGLHDRDSETFYLQRLFAISGAAGATGTPPVTATTIAPGELSQQLLDNFAAVIFTDVPSVAAKDVDAIRDYVQRGGGLIVFCGEHVQASFYNDELMRRARLLPASFGEARGDAVTLQANRFTHPIAEIWNDTAAGSPASVHVTQRMPLEPDVAGKGRIVLTFSDGTPAVMEQAFGAGRVIQSAMPASAKWDDLPLHPGIFVPLIFRSLSAIVSRQDEQLNVPVGGTFIFHPGAQVLNREATIIRPGENATAPHDVRPVQLVAGEPTVKVEQTDLAGAYSVTFAEGPGILFAVQSDPRESIVQSLNVEERRELESVAQVVDLSRGGSIAAGQMEAGAEGSRAEMWPLLAGIVVALAAVEMIFAWWFSRPK